MIRHVHNTIPQSDVPAAKATRASSPTDSDSDSFRKLFSSSTYQPTSSSASSFVSTPAAITATVTKPAVPVVPPVVTLSPPQYQQGATVTSLDGTVTPLYPTELATMATAQEIAAKLGGTVATSTLDGFSTGQLGIRVPGSPNLVNAGLAADLFARYGDQKGSLAWQIINNDLGIKAT